jgi:hypothetical protein
MSWFGSLFTSAGGATAPRPENLKPKASNAAKAPNATNANKNTVLTVAPVDPTATQLKVVPHPTASQGQQGGRRKTKGKGRKAKSKGRSRKAKSKSRQSRK